MINTSYSKLDILRIVSIILLLILLASIFCSCGPAVKYTPVDQTSTSKPVGCPLDIYMPDQNIPLQTKVIGSFSIGDAMGLTPTSLCGWDDVLMHSKKKACAAGADAIQFYKVTSPAWSTCYSAEANFLAYSDKTSDGYLVHQGDQYLEEEELDKAYEYYLQALDVNPHNAEAFHGVGRVFMRKGEDEKAEEYLKKALAEQEDLWTVWHNLGWIYRDTGRYAEMREAFEQAIFYSDQPYGWNQVGLGVAYYYLDDFPKAERSLQKALNMEDMADSHLNALFWIGATSYKQGNKTEANKHFTRYIDQHAQKPKAYTDIGRFFYDQNDYDRAEEYLNKALEIDANYQEARVQLLLLVAARGDYALAKQLFTKNPYFGIQFRITEGGGRVAKINKHSFAELAGLRRGDLITAVNGKSLATKEILPEAVQASHYGDTLNLTVKRGDKSFPLQVVFDFEHYLTEKPASTSSPKEEVVATSQDTTPPRIIIIIIEPADTRGLVLDQKTTETVIRGTITDSSGVSWAKMNEEPLMLDSEGNFEHRVRLRAGQSELIVRAADPYGNIAEKVMMVEPENPAAEPSPEIVEVPLSSPKAPKPTLWVLTIGVSRYQDSKLNLAFAANDAQALADTLKRSGADLYDEVLTNVLVDESATRDNIVSAMAKFLGQASQGDVVVIFIAGHGIKHKATGSYYFLTHDADADNLVSRGLRMSDFEEMINILGRNIDKIVLAIDTCHAGAMKIMMRGVEAGEDLATMIQEGSGLYTLSASKPGEQSIEHEKFKIEAGGSGHGAFTFALIRGLQGEANYDGNSYISVVELFNYVAKLVPRISEGYQHPYAKISGTDIPLVLSK